MPDRIFPPVSTLWFKPLRSLLPTAAVIFLLALAGLACSLSGGSASPVPPATSMADSLTNPSTGLEELSSYRASLHIGFDGTKDGEPLAWSQDLLLEADRTTSARLLTMNVHGPDLSQDATGTLAGQFGSMSLYRAEALGACRAEVVETPLPVPEPASLLRPLLQPVNFSESPEQRNGISSLHAALDNQAVGASSAARVTGELWVAKDGGYIVSYVLEIEGKADDWGKGIEGTMRWEYDLEEVNQNLGLLPPSGCPLGMVIAPTPGDAASVEAQPGSMTLTTGQDVIAVGKFYRTQLPLEGWVETQPGFLTSRAARLTFLKPGQQLVVHIQDGPPTQVWLTLENPAVSAVLVGAATATPAGQSGNQAVDPMKRVVASVNSLQGLVAGTSTFPSCHLEVEHGAPVWANGKLAQEQELLSADVQGKNVHFTDRTTDAGGSTTTTEAYLMGDQEYDVLNGQLQPPGVSFNSLAWSLWTLDPVMIISSGASGATAAGTEELDGRTAEIYDLNGTGSALAGVTGIGLQITSVTGKVWIDQQSGALLKAVLDYQAEVNDSGGNLKGNGSGHLEISVTQIGNVTVVLPGQ
jgi:hypothetical protein